MSEWSGLPPQPPAPQVKDQHIGRTIVPAGHSTPLHRVADLIAAGCDYLRVELYEDQVYVHVYEREHWLAWITALHGSPDGANAAVREEWPLDAADWKWRWLTPDGRIAVAYLATDPETPSETDLETGGDPS